MVVENQTEADESVVHLIIYDNTTFPSPPKKFTLTVKKEDSVEDLVRQVATTTGYREDVFELTCKGKRMEPNTKKMGEYQSSKLMLNISKAPNAKVESHTQCRTHAPLAILDVTNLLTSIPSSSAGF